MAYMTTQIAPFELTFSSALTAAGTNRRVYSLEQAFLLAEQACLLAEQACLCSPCMGI